ncbi:MAG TPA: metallophosphoesterase [Prolixibacteraceae bacterium]|jgi:predicted MPP superfamily phosphohydrolase|nr:metallophosphoesterase [Prolixibacteraceae bacterium]
MRSTGFLIFFSIVLFIYGSVNYYLFARGLQAFALSQPMKRWYIAIFWVVVSMFIVGNVLERTATSVFSEWIYRIGAFWMAFMLYLFIALVLIDVVRILNYFFHFLPPFTPLMRFRLGIIVFSLAALVVAGGYINALWTNVKVIPLTIHKKVSGPQEVKILMASDLHLGALIGERREKHLLELIQQQKPDLVLLCGDLVDGDIAPVLRKNLGRHIQEIKTPMGVYAITGNHEFIGGINKTLPYLRSINIRMLLDETITLPNGIQLVGRIDRAGSRGPNTLKSLNQLMAGIDTLKPIIVMNHQPVNLKEASDAKVDLHLSGHTHNGQMWPFNYITQAVYELSWGLRKVGTTNFYVSSGYGSWGPPVRSGNRPEVVIFNLKFDQ